MTIQHTPGMRVAATGFGACPSPPVPGRHGSYPDRCPACGAILAFQEQRLFSGPVYEAQALCLRCKLEIICAADGSVRAAGRWMARAFTRARVDRAREERANCHFAVNSGCGVSK